MLIIFHDARNFPTFFKFLRWKITSIVSNVSTVTRVLYWTVVEKVGISLKDVITTTFSKNIAIICWFSEVISKLVLFSKVLIIFHGARNFPTFSGFLHGKLRARDCNWILDCKLKFSPYKSDDIIKCCTTVRTHCSVPCRESKCNRLQHWTNNVTGQLGEQHHVIHCDHFH